MPIQFDPIDYVQQLEAAGVPKAQAEVHAKTLDHLVSSCVACSHGLNLIRQEIHSLEEKVSLRFEALEERMRLQFEALEIKLTGQINALDTKFTGQINALDTKFTGQITQLRWMLGTVVAMNIAILVKLFIP